MRVAILDAAGVITQIEDITEKGMEEGYRPEGAWVEAAEDWVDCGSVTGGVYSPPVHIPTVDEYRAAIVALLDAKAQERRYDNAVSIATYTDSTNPQWIAEALAFVAWRDAVWVYAYTELDKVMTGQRLQPTIAELVAELPVMVWPA